MKKIILLLFTLVSCKEEILHDLSETQANQVWLTLERQNIEVEKKKSASGWGILVETNLAVQALQTLQDLKLPHGIWRDKEVNSSSLIPSKEERQLNRERELGRTLEGTLLSLPGVSDAHVHLVIPTLDKEGLQKTSASVLVISDGKDLISAQQIRDLAAGATAIQKENVAVAIVLREMQKEKITTTNPPTSSASALVQELPLKLLIIGMMSLLVLTLGFFILKKRKLLTLGIS